MRESGERGCGRWTVCAALCLLAIFLSGAKGDFASADADVPDGCSAMVAAPGWESVLLWQANAGDAPWACPWCGKKDNAECAPLCPACGYPAWNPGGYLVRPVDAYLITSGYSPGHKAVDFGAREGSPVYAAADGVVVEARKDRWAGNILRVEHEGGLQTYYGHLREIRACPGSFVRAGEVIAFSGRTGTATGPHLHFEAAVRGEQVDPLTRLAP